MRIVRSVTRIAYARLTPQMTVWQLATAVYKNVDDNRLFSGAAAILGYATMAAAPFLVVMISLAFSVDATQAVRTELLNLAEEYIPSRGLTWLKLEVEHLQQGPRYAIASLGFFAMLFHASVVDSEIMSWLNVIYHVRETRNYWRRKLIAMSLTFLQCGALLLVVVLFYKWGDMSSYLGLPVMQEHIWLALKTLAEGLGLMGGYQLLFTVGPNHPPGAKAHKWNLPGSCFGAIAFMIMATALRWYLEHWGTSYDLLYYALDFAILCWWTYITALVLLVAAEINTIIELARNDGQLTEMQAADTSALNITETAPLLDEETNQKSERAEEVARILATGYCVPPVVEKAILACFSNGLDHNPIP